MTVGRHVDSDQAEVRSAALDVVESCYISLDMDSARIHRLLGTVNDKTKTLVEEVRMKSWCIVVFDLSYVSSGASSIYFFLCARIATALRPPPTQRIKAAVRKVGKASAATGDTSDGGPRDDGDPVSGPDRQRRWVMVLQMAYI